MTDEQTHIILFSEDPSKNANIGQQIAHRRQAVNDAQLLLATYTTGLIEGKGLDPSLIIQIVDKEQGQPFGFLIKGPDLSLAENPSVPTGDTSPTIKRDSPDA